MNIVFDSHITLYNIPTNAGDYIDCTVPCYIVDNYLCIIPRFYVDEYHKVHYDLKYNDLIDRLFQSFMCCIEKDADDWYECVNIAYNAGWLRRAIMRGAIQSNNLSLYLKFRHEDQLESSGVG